MHDATAALLSRPLGPLAEIGRALVEGLADCGPEREWRPRAWTWICPSCESELDATARHVELGEYVTHVPGTRVGIGLPWFRRRRPYLLCAACACVSPLDDMTAMRVDMAELRARLAQSDSDVWERDAQIASLVRELRDARDELRVLRRQLAALQGSAQRAAREGQVELLAAELPAAWRHP